MKDKLFRLALRMTMQREEAEDIVQEVMIKLWNNRDNWPNIDNIESYAMTMCHHQSLDHLRKKSIRIMPIESTKEEEAGVNPYAQIYAQEQLQLVHNLMTQLPEKQRMCMHLRDFEGKNYKEIAAILDISEDQVKINIYRARNFIKKSCTSV